MSATQSSPAEFRLAMGPVAKALRGEPNTSLSSKNELRFGSRGALSVDLRKGVWSDHETGEGGGLLEFVQREKRTDKAGALDYLAKAGHIAPPDPDHNVLAKYDYFDETGVLLFQVVRKQPKKFIQRRLERGEWVWSTKGVRRVLYRLPQVIEAVAAGETVYVVEGEKDVHALEGLGLVATTNPGGACKWQNAYSATLAGADIVILGDNDDTGREHVKQVYKALNGTAGRVRVVDLPGLPDKGDVADWVGAGGTLEALEALVSGATAGAPPKPESVPAKETASIEAVSPTADRDFAAEIDAAIQRLNAKYALVKEGGKAVVFQEGFDPILQRHHIDRISPSDLCVLYQNERVQVGVDEKANPVFKPVARLWLAHRDRRQFIDGVTFDPTTTESRPGVLNLWRGFAVKPTAGDWSLLRNHIRDVICDRNKTHDAYLIRSMARMVQFPGRQGEVAVVMKGKEGCGKGTLARALLKVMGQHGLAISNAKHLIGNFNGHLRDAVMLFADEAFFAGDRAHVGVLKSLISEPYLTIEAKFQNASQMPNYLHIFMASNEEWVVPASLEARRFFVLDVPDNVIGNHAYFDAIWRQMDAGGYEAMLHDLLRLDLTHFNVRSVPASDALQNQRKLSLPIPEAWWKECLERGYVFRSKLGLQDYFGQWCDTVSTELLHDSYMEFVKPRGARDLMGREQLGRFVRQMGGVSTRPENGVVGEQMTDEDTSFGNSRRVAKVVSKGRPQSYRWGTLDDARAAFAIKTGLKVDWDHDKPPNADRVP